MGEPDGSISENVSEICDTLSLAKILPWNLTVYIVVIVTALISNALLLFAMCKDPLKCFVNPTSYFIRNLAVADLLNAMFNLEELFLSQTMYKSIFCLPGIWGVIHIHIETFIYYLTYPCVTILALERYLSVAYPLWQKVKVTIRLCGTSVTLLWFLCLFSAGISHHHNRDVTLVFSMGFTCTFYSATVAIYLLAYISIRKQRSTLITGSLESENMKRVLNIRLKNQSRFLSTILIVNLTLTFALIPPSLSAVWKYFLSTDVISGRSLQVLYSTGDILFFLNMAANPFLYIWRLPKYRKSFLVLYCNKT